MDKKISLPKITIWHIILVCLALGLMTWWWFDRQIDTINSQIEIMHQ